MTGLRVPTQSPIPAGSSVPPDEGNLALLAGGGAALIGGAVWALIVAVTDMEVGYVAWGVGWLVGLSMVRFTTRRGRAFSALAATFAAIGLIFGKVLILQFVSGPAFDSYLRADSTGMASAATWELRREHKFPAGLQSRIDALGENDTLPDALWDEMFATGKAEVARRSPEQQAALAQSYVTGVKRRLGFWRRLSWHLSPWDLLWFGLAISTGWSMLARRTPAAAPKRT